MNFKNSTSVVLLCLCSIFTHFNSISQDTAIKGQKKVFKVNMHTDSGLIKGYVNNVSDSAVTISSNLIIYHDSVLTDADWFKTSNYNTIKTITIIRKGSVLTSTLVGAATGAIIGLVTYKSSASFFGPGVSAFAGGILGTSLGIIAGVLFHTKKFHVNRDINRFQTFRLYVNRKVNPISLN